MSEHQWFSCSKMHERAGYNKKTGRLETWCEESKDFCSDTDCSFPKILKSLVHATPDQLTIIEAVLSGEVDDYAIEDVGEIEKHVHVDAYISKPEPAGNNPATPRQSCPDCRGFGERIVNKSTHSEYMPCPACFGVGWEPGSRAETDPRKAGSICPTCGGSGYVPSTDIVVNGEVIKGKDLATTSTGKRPCPTCGGGENVVTGADLSTSGSPCPDCEGKGWKVFPGTISGVEGRRNSCPTCHGTGTK